MRHNTLYLILITATLYINLKAIPNFDLINGDPKIPIHVQANGGPWQTLNQQHYRFPIDVPKNSLLVMSLSANEDKSAPTSLIFAPERALDVAKQVGSKITKAPTFYAVANVVIEKVPGSEKTIKHVQLMPQISSGTSNKTKSGLSLENNVTQEMIDAIVGIASSENSEPEEQAEPETIDTKEPEPVQSDSIGSQAQLIEQNAPPTSTAFQQSTEPTALHPVQKPIEPSEPQKLETPSTPQTIGPTIQTTPLQHTDTPQMILARLKKITKRQPHANKQTQWNEVRNYLICQQAQDLFKDHDDAYIYSHLKNHYQALADKTKSSLKKSYTRIAEIITKTYKCANS